MDRFTLKLFGTFRLTRGDGSEIPIRSAKSKALLALLATAADGQSDREPIRKLLWQRSSRSGQRDSLNAELSSLRAILRDHGAAHLLPESRTRIRLNKTIIDIDWPEPEDGPVLDEGLHEATFLETIDLPGCTAWDQWVATERARLRTIRLRGAGAQRKIEHVYGAPVPPAGKIIEATTLPRPPKPSVVVMPFATVAADERWLGIALAESLTILLSYFPQLFVVDSNSATSMATMGLLRQEIAERLGVRYTIDGRIMKIEDKLRISVSLVDSDNGEQIWGDVFMAVADGSGAMEQNIANQIAPRIWSKVDVSERQQGLRRLGIGSGLYQRWWQASALFRGFDRNGVLDAAKLANGLAVEEPNCPFSTSLAAFLNGLCHLLGFTPNDGAAKSRAHQLCTAAMRCGPDNVEALGYCVATQLMIVGDLELAETLVARALSILPSYQPSLFWGGWVDVVAGRPDRARERLELALRINPVTGVRGPTLCAIGFSLLQKLQWQEALHILSEARKSDPGFPLTYPGILVAASMLGDQDAASMARARIDEIGEVRFVELFQSPVHRQIFASVLENTT